MRLPDFMIIGAAKSGTTTLYQYLCRHPQVFMSIPKEPEFFAKDENYAKGLEWYASLFSPAKPDQVCGEASTIYTRSPQFPETASRIAQAVPNVKLIYLMRNPVDRAYSHYVQRIKTAQNTQRQLEVQETFEENIQRDSLFLDSSNYIYQIEQYLKFFPRDSILLLLMDDFIQNKAEILAKVCQFIGVDPSIDLIQNNPISANEARTHIERILRSQITAPLKSLPGMSLITSKLPKDWREQMYQFLAKLPYKKEVEKRYVPAPMRPETRQMLLEKFQEPNQKLAAFLNRDLSHWSK